MSKRKKKKQQKHNVACADAFMKIFGFTRVTKVEGEEDAKIQR